MVMRTCHIGLSCWALLWEPPVPNRAFSFVGWDRVAHRERHYRHMATGGVISSQYWASCLKHDVQPCFCKISSSSLFFIWYHAEYFSDPRSLHYLLTSWNSVLLVKLTGSQLVKKFPALYGTRRFIQSGINQCVCVCVCSVKGLHSAKGSHDHRCYNADTPFGGTLG